MSHPRNSSRLATVALVLAGAALAACAEGELPLAPRPAAARVAADAAPDSAVRDSVARDSAARDSAAADSLGLPAQCVYAPDSAGIDSTGVDPSALAAAFTCRDSVALQYPFDYPAGDAFALPDGVSIVGAITGTAPELAPTDSAASDSAASDSAASDTTVADSAVADGAGAAVPPLPSPCAGADTVGAVGPSSIVVCLTLRNDGADTTRVTLPAGLVVIAERPGVQNGVVVTPIAIDVPGDAARTVAVALYATRWSRQAGVAQDAYQLGPVSAHPLVRALLDAVADPARALTEPAAIQDMVWMLAEHGNDEMTGLLVDLLHGAPELRAGALRAARARIHR